MTEPTCVAPRLLLACAAAAQTAPGADYRSRASTDDSTAHSQIVLISTPLLHLDRSDHTLPVTLESSIQTVPPEKHTHKQNALPWLASRIFEMFFFSRRSLPPSGRQKQASF
jgi:hypothetical protein